MQALERGSALFIMKLITKDKFDTLTDDQIREQIQFRNNLIADMVGWLYPRILAEEIRELTDVWRKKHDI